VSVSRLERVLDSAPWRACEWTAKTARRLAKRQPPRGDAPQSTLADADRTLAGPMSDGELEGALETLLSYAERERARSIAERERDRLETTDRGSTILDLLGVREAPIWLPSGRLNLLGIDRRLEEGSLDPDWVLAALMRRPTALLRAPEAHLLLFNAWRLIDGDRARRAMNRFLREWDLPPLIRLGEEVPLLSAMTFERPKQSDGPLVSVVMSAFNAERTIDYALRSLLTQSHRSLEILVCDDASTDATLSIARGYTTDPRVRVFRSAANQGTYNIRNALLSRASGRILTAHDADDVALPTRIAMQVAALERTRRPATIGRFIRMTPEGRVPFFRNQSAIRLGLVTTMMTRACFDSIGPYRSARYGADLEHLEDLRARYGEPARVRTPLMIGLWSPASATRTHGAEALADGYRSPGRRLYNQLVHQKRRGEVTDAEIVEQLRGAGNYAEPVDIVEHR
jgi:hypothetical protein